MACNIKNISKYRIGSLSVSAINQLVSHISNVIFSAIDNSKTKSLSGEEVSNIIYNEVNTLINNEKKKAQVYLTKKRFDKYAEDLESIRDEIRNIEDIVFSIVGDYTGIKEVNKETETVTDDTTKEGKDYSKTIFEENGKKSMSYRIRRLLAGIKKLDTDNNEVKGFLGTSVYISPDIAYSIVQNILSSEPTNSNFDTTIDALEKYRETYPWLATLIDRLKLSDQSTKNQFKYYLTKVIVAPIYVEAKPTVEPNTKPTRKIQSNNYVIKEGYIEFDKNNSEFNKAVEFVRDTDKPLYLTGKAGTGKTTFLKYIKNTTDKNMVILAPTGVAAINAGGVTIHSFFQIPLGPFLPNDPRLRMNAMGSENKETIYTTFRYRDNKRKIIKNLEVLIIDEVSMVRCDVLDVIDKILRVFREKPRLPFGGVQVILIGDTFQLPPIVKNEQWHILSQFYKTRFFFSSKVIEETTLVYIELKKIYRQNEQEFINLLNRVRVNNVSRSDYQMLHSRYNPTFTGDSSDYIILATHNDIVDKTNLTKLNQLETELFRFKGNVTGDFPDKHKPTNHLLELKVGAQVMFIKNDTGALKRYFNGKIGKIKELEEKSITIVFDDESEVEVERAVWHNIQYIYNKDEKKVEEKIIGTFEQFPIRLAWAITVHKSQGLTFEKVIADLSKAFAPGQVYVALSRCTSFSGLQLKTELNQYAIKTDPEVLEFAQAETPDTLITEHLNTGKADFYYRKAREQFGKGNIKFSFESFKQALKFRNDIDTDDFQRFILVQGKRLLNFKQKNSSLLEQLELTNNMLDEAKETIDLQAQKLSNESTELSKITKFEKKTERLKKELKRLKKKLTDFQVRANKDKAEIEQLKNLK